MKNSVPSCLSLRRRIGRSFCLPLHGVAALFLLGAGSVSASETILRYNMISQPGDQVVSAATQVAPGLIAQDVVRGPGINATNLVRSKASNNWSTLTPGVDGRQNAIAEGEYFQFAFTVEEGHIAYLSTLDHSLRRTAVNAPMNYEWHVSFDDFTNSSFVAAQFQYFGRSSGTAPTTAPIPYSWMTTDVPGQNEGNPMATMDLTTSPQLQGIPGGTTVTFRLYGWGNANTAGTNSIALGRDSATQVGGPMIQGIVTLDTGAGVPLQVRSEIPSTNPEPGVHFYPAGTEVTASADIHLESAGVRYVPVGWTGSGSVASGEGDTVTFTLNDSSLVDWEWERHHRLQVAAQGNGSVSVTTTRRVPILGWDFAGYRYNADPSLIPAGSVSNADGVPASTVAPGVSPSIIVRSPWEEFGETGLRPADLGAGAISSDMWRHTPDLPTAIERRKYLEFKVSPTAGSDISLHSLFFHYRYTASGPHSIALLYSTDDFATYSVIESVRIQDQASGTQTTSRTINFPDHPALRNVTQELTFRLYGWGGTGSGVGTFAIYNAFSGMDDLVLFGGVPETFVVAGTQNLWLDPALAVDVDAIPGAGAVFTGWSGSFVNNRPSLHGMDMTQPLTFTATFATDSDGDGIPDEWKIRYFGNLSAGANDDPDGDGFTNYEEYLRGTDPTVAETLIAGGDIPLSMWENPQRDPLLAGAFIVRDFGGGFKGIWEGSNHSRSAQDPYHPEGGLTNVVDNVSFDGPRLILGDDIWEAEWDNATYETVFSVGDDDGNCFYFRYQDELNWYRVSIAGEISAATTRPRIGISVQKRVNGIFSDLAPAAGLSSDPNDNDGYKRIRVRITAVGPELAIDVQGWENSSSTWETGSWGRRQISLWDADLTWGRAGFGTWAQGSFPAENQPAWNPVNGGTLFESFRIFQNSQLVFADDWATAPVAAVPAGWTNAFAGVTGLSGTWRLSAHGSLAQTTAQGGAITGAGADADGPTLVAPALETTNYVLDLGFHPFNRGAVGFVFDYVDQNNYSRVLFANTLVGTEGAIPSGVVVSRKEGGIWSHSFIGDTSFIYEPGKPFYVTFNRSGSNYSMTVFEEEAPGVAHRWQWSGDAGVPGGRHGFTSWQSAHAHFLHIEAYAAVAGQVGDLAIVGISRMGESIVLEVDNPSGAPYAVQRSADLVTWETVATEQTGATWTGPIPVGANRAFWRLSR